MESNAVYSHRYGCFNREPYKPSFIAKDRVVDGDDWVDVYKVVEFRMEPTCQYRHSELGQQDKMCEGCKWKQVE